MLRVPLTLASVLLLGGCQLNTSATVGHQPISAAITPVSDADPHLSPSQQLATVIARYWQAQLNANPQLAQRLGNTTAARLLPDLSPQTLQQRYQLHRQLLAEIQQLDTEQLTAKDNINATLLMYQLNNHIDNYHYKDHYQPISAESGFHAHITQISQNQFNTITDYENYLARLHALPKYFAQQTYWLKQGMMAGITPPKVTLQGFEASIRAYQVDVEQSSYYQAFANIPSHISPAEQQRLKAAGHQVITEQVLPLYDDFYHFMTQEYLPNARESIAAADLPNGAAFYENRVRYYTTLGMSADEVHQLGLKEVARIRAEMQAIIDELQFEGSFADFLYFLRTNPQFYAKTAEELLKQAAFIAKKADAILPKYFATLPRTPYGIKEVPAEIAPKYTTGRYSGARHNKEAGYYWVNTYALDKRPLYEMEALTLHEAVPGHHLQIALNQEQQALPDFRRYSYISAFGEGWGLYAEYLGLEAGFYQDPYSDFGRLTYEMWRACRLVVDTGLHIKGWSRQQALDYMATNTALSLHNVTTEIDRYIAWPGQAVSYKIGELAIKRLRKQAEEALGEQFDIRTFHDAILQHGAVTLPILEQQVKQYIHQHQ